MPSGPSQGNPGANRDCATCDRPSTARAVAGVRLGGAARRCVCPAARPSRTAARAWLGKVCGCMQCSFHTEVTILTCSQHSLASHRLSPTFFVAASCYPAEVVMKW